MNNRKINYVFSWIIVVGIAFSLPFFISNEYYLHVFTMIFINILVASSFRLIMTTGLVSFCHSAFLAIGGYTSALAVLRLGLNSWLGLCLAIGVAIIISVLFGVILLRLRGTYFFIATFAFGEVIMLTFTRFNDPFGGPAGLVNIPVPDSITIPYLITIVFGSKVSFYYLALIMTLVLMFLIYPLVKGRMGTIWSGIQQAELLAQSVGVNVMLYKVIAFTIGSAIAAIGGAFQTHYFNNIHPGSFGFIALMSYLTFVIVGGKNKFMGPIIGTVLMTLIAESLALNEALVLYQAIIYGLILIVCVMFLPEGLMSLPSKMSAWYYKRAG